MLLSRLSGSDSDLVVDARSALAGTHRFGLAWSARVEGPDVDHFHYFTNADSASLALTRLSSGTATGWQRLREGAGLPPASARAANRPGDDPAIGAAFPTLLRRGAQGQDVTQLQTALKHHGAQLEADGLFGPSTEMAVRQFQQAHGLPADGIAGPQTLSVLLRDTAA
ncbi:MAG: peptidoglycan-binding protein [Proteobacteria bacterium]|nr:peptidoglycan-binding protein [Pseudomonadota bacterium]